MYSLLYLGNCIPPTVGYSQNPRRIIRNSGLGLLLTRMTVSRTHSFDTENFLFLSLLCGLFHSAIHVSCLCPKLSKYIVLCLALASTDSLSHTDLGMCVLSRDPLFVIPWTVARQLCCPWDSPGKKTGMGCHFLLQGNFLTQELNPGLSHYRRILYHLSHQGKPTLGMVLGKTH